MAKLDIELSNNVTDEIRFLAMHHYGNSGDASVDRVVEAALQMRLVWMDLVGEGGNEVDEPLLGWEFASRAPADQSAVEIRSWLFGRR